MTENLLRKTTKSNGASSSSRSGNSAMTRNLEAEIRDHCEAFAADVRRVAVEELNSAKRQIRRQVLDNVTRTLNSLAQQNASQGSFHSIGEGNRILSESLSRREPPLEETKVALNMKSRHFERFVTRIALSIGKAYEIQVNLEKEIAEKEVARAIREGERKRDILRRHLGEVLLTQKTKFEKIIGKLQGEKGSMMKMNTDLRDELTLQKTKLNAIPGYLNRLLGDFTDDITDDTPSTTTAGDVDTVSSFKSF